MKKNKVLLLTTTALFTALVTVGTAVIQIPVGSGYAHFGDSMIYLSACILPGPYAIFAASVGAAIADLATGFVIYAPATVIIKALNALPFVLMRVYLKKKNKDDRILNWQISLMLVPTTLVTIFGYLIAEYIMFGQKFALVSAFTDGWLQPGGSLAVFVILAVALDKIHFKKSIIKELPNSKRYKEIHTMKTDIVYKLGEGTYLNITNKCPCRCAFCIRSQGDAVGDAERLWFDTEPTMDDIKKAIDAFDFSGVKEVVFCGYGEPTNAYDNLIATAKYMRETHPSIKIRLNTNGLSDLINEKPTAKELCSVLDSISVSLNDTDSEKYDKITRNIYPGIAFDAMLDFTKECVKYCDDVRMTVVDVIPEEDIEASRKICESCGAKFRVRSFSKGQ